MTTKEWETLKALAENARFCMMLSPHATESRKIMQDILNRAEKIIVRELTKSVFADEESRREGKSKLTAESPEARDTMKEIFLCWCQYEDHDLERFIYHRHLHMAEGGGL